MAASDKSNVVEQETTWSLSDEPIVQWREEQLLKWKGFWLMPKLVKSVMTIQSHYKPLDSDIILASFPKTGTTWLKALTHTILSNNSSSTDPLSTHNPHQLVPFLELETFGENPSQEIDRISSARRVFSTHLPYSILPENVRASGCRIVYISRNPADTFVSYWKFFNKRSGIDMPIEEAFEGFCSGVVPGGPFFEHVLEYWENRDEGRMLFVTYEELEGDPNKHVKRLSNFLGCSLDKDEIEQVVQKCSIERLRNSDVNKDDHKVHFSGVQYSSFFRQGAVGDWKNYLSPAMIKRLENIMSQKWQGSGLVFKH